jgi:hypothetical protein
VGHRRAADWRPRRPFRRVSRAARRRRAVRARPRRHGPSTSALGFLGGAGLLLGAAQSGTTYAVIYGVIGRNVAADKRSWAMGITAAAARSASS